MFKMLKRIMDRFFKKQTVIEYTPVSTNVDDYLTSEVYDNIDDDLSDDSFYENNDCYMVDYEFVHESILANLDKTNDTSLIVNDLVESEGFVLEGAEIMGANELLGFTSKVCLKLKDYPVYLMVTVGTPS